MGGLVIALAVVAALLFAGVQLAISRGSAALLDRADLVLRGSGGVARVVKAARYGGDPAQRVDVWAPTAPAAAPRPVIVFYFGGGWHSGTPEAYGFIGRHFARLGYVVVLPGYRLVPGGEYPHMLEDSAAGLRWALDHVAQVGGDPARIFVMGHSAGAYNAVMLALDPRWLAAAKVPADTIKGAIGLAGPYDFYPFTSDSAKQAFATAPDPRVTQPINYVRADAPPLLLVTGDADTVVRPRNSLALARAMTAIGVPLHVVVFPGVGHQMLAMKLAAPFDRDPRVRDATLAFLAAHGAPSAPVQAPGG